MNIANKIKRNIFDITASESYILGSVYRMSYRDVDGNLFFSSINNKPQKSNNAGMAFKPVYFKAMKELLIEFSSWFEDAEIIDGEIEVRFPKIRKNQYALVKSIDGTSGISDLSIDFFIEKSVSSHELAVEFVRGWFESGSSPDATTGYLPVDINKNKAENKFKNFSKIFVLTGYDKVEFNFNARADQPGDSSKQKNPQIRPNIINYLHFFGTRKKFIIDKFYSQQIEKMPKQNAMRFLNSIKNIIEFEGVYYCENVLNNKIKFDLEEAEIKAQKDEFAHKYNALTRKKIRAVKKTRKHLSTKEKLRLYEYVFENKTVNNKRAKLNEVEWHHAIPNSYKDNNLIDVDSIENFVPLTPNDHSLIDKKINTLDGVQIANYKSIVDSIVVHLREKKIPVESEQLIKIYEKYH